MENHQNTYQQQVPPEMEQPMMPPQGHPIHRTPRSWQQRLLGGSSARPLTLRQERTLPDWLVGKSVLFFFISFAACTIVWGRPMELRDAIISAVSVCLFFYGCRSMSLNWLHTKERIFLRNTFVAALMVRLVWVIYCYFIFNPNYYGNTFGETADVDWYMPYAKSIAEWVRGDSDVTFGQIMDMWGGAIDDVGYPIWLALINIITFDWSDVFVPFVVKCIVGAYCAICIYHVAKRHYGVGTARLAALFVALNPNMIYWCGNMFKETEMVFLCCLCVDLVDKTFTSGQKLTFKGLLPGIFAGFSLFFFRAALGMVMFIAMLAHIVMSSKRVMSAGKKIIAGVLVAFTLFVGMGEELRSQAESIIETVQSDSQQKNMEWRSKREGGNEFAKYASAAVFAPLIFTIPFPTFNAADVGQILQMQLSGGSYIKNIFSYFVILIMFMMLLNGDWRKHVYILAYTLGYLMCLVLSDFAQSGRFHMPIWPMLMLFAAYGIQVAKANPKIKRWFPMVLVLEVLACLAWNWFKMAGRGLA